MVILTLGDPKKHREIDLKPQNNDFFWGVKELIEGLRFLGYPLFDPLFSVVGGRQKHGRGNDTFLQFWPFLKKGVKKWTVQKVRKNDLSKSWGGSKIRIFGSFLAFLVIFGSFGHFDHVFSFCTRIPISNFGCFQVFTVLVILMVFKTIDAV